ncbi:MAG: TusE/DsrC/DsvC family sulfur relay protein [Pseudomonadota bacterium]
MVDIKKFIHEGAEESPQLLNRKQEMPELDWRRVSQRAAEEDVILKDEHREVVRFLREYYLYNGWPESASELTRELEEAFDEHGGKKYLYRLFPNGPIAQATDIAELPKPAELEQPSQGTVH